MTIKAWGSMEGHRQCLRCGQNWVEKLEKDDRFTLKGYTSKTRAMKDDFIQRSFQPKRVLKINSYDDLKRGAGQIISR